MKTTRALLALFSAMAAASIASAQSIDFLFLTKRVNYTQTTASSPGAADNYEFYASIDGTDLSGSYPTPLNRVFTPGGIVSSVTLSIPNDNWEISGYTYADSTTLNNHFNDGTFTFSINNGADTVGLALNGDLYPNTPYASIATNSGLGYSWVGGVLQVNPGLFSTLTITTNAFSTNFASAGNNHIGISGKDFGGGVDSESFSDVDGILTLQISAATFLGGGSNKGIEIEFNNIIDFLGDTPFAGPTSASAFTSLTKFSIQVIPEPSTYAEIFGALALAGAMLHRRRRQMA